MIVVRNVFQAKYGRGDELVELLKEGRGFWPEDLHPPRILTDVSGAFFTVVMEYETDSLTQFEELQPRLMEIPEFGPWFERMMELVEGGTRDFYTVEA